MEATGAVRALTEELAELPEHLQELGQFPRLGLWLTELHRGAGDMALMYAAAHWLERAPRGDGHGVLVLPGLLTGDASTRPLRRYLRSRGYTVWGWRQGRNLGPRAHVLDGLPQELEAMAGRTGGPVSLIGWSMGGIFARHVARAHPELVRQVITLGSPFGVSHGHRTRADRIFERLSFLHAEADRLPDRERLADPLPVPTSSFYSRWDGIVGWRACLESASERGENIEVRCAHIGFGFDPPTLWAVADRLAQPRDDWQPFRPTGWLRPLYGRIS